MTRQVFSVSIPNASSTTVDVQLRLEPVSAATLKGLNIVLPPDDLKIAHAGIASDPCARAGEPRTSLQLPPFTSVDMHIIVDTAGAASPAATGLQLIDHRQGKDVGGVLVVVCEPPIAEPPPQHVPALRPCPVSLRGHVYAVPIGKNPADLSLSVPLEPFVEVDLVAMVVNGSNRDLSGAHVYLEHLGTSGSTFMPGTWTIGRMARGDLFYATWRVTPAPGQGTKTTGSLVAIADGCEPTRLGFMFADPVDRRTSTS